MICYMAEAKARQFAIEIARIASENKCEDVVAFDLRGISPVTDFTIIATGTSGRQMHAVMDAVVEYGRRIGERVYGVSGRDSDAWVLLDFVDVVLHIFAGPYRQYYDLELLWGDAPPLQWARSESA